MSETNGRALTALRSQLTEMRPHLAAALPAQIPADRFIRTVSTAVQIQPELLECDRKSLLLATLRAAQDGLLPDGRHGAFVVFNDRKAGTKRAQWWPEMARKTVIRRLYKFLPSSADLDNYLGVRTDLERELAPAPADKLAEAPLPDDESLERSVFHITCEARAALDGCETKEQAEHVWKTAVAELKKLDRDPPLELEAAYHDRLEALAQRKGEAA